MKIAQAVTELAHELKVSITFILNTINANLDLPHLSRSPNLKHTLDMLRQASDTNGLIFHTDQDLQYQQFQAWLKNNGIVQSM